MNRSERIGPYRLEGLLGRGGVGAVYRASHLQSGLLVALKALETSAASFPSTLRREVAALARLRHPGIVRVLDSGLHDGLPWVAMELVEGPTLRQHAQKLREASSASLQTELLSTLTLTSHPEPAKSEPAPLRPPSASFQADPRPTLPPARLRAILTLVRRICSPLAYLHGEGIVHRDLKPENILLRPDSTPVLVDFGLVSEFSGPLSRETLAVDTGSSGTVRYMAPEQIQGRLVDARADLYALGCILYELLTGQTPFRGLPAELVKAHLHSTPTRPSAVVEGLPAEIDELVLRLLEKEPRRRLGHADDVAATLGALGAAAGGVGLEGPAARPYLYRPELAGREDLLEVLEARLDPPQAPPQLVRRADVRAPALPEPGASQGSRSGLVLLGGESGVGKSRLALELGRRAEQRGWRVLTGESVPTVASGEQPAAGSGRAQPSEPATGGSRLSATGGPLHPLRKALQAIADRCRSFGLEETERLLGRRGKLLALYEPALAGLPGQEAHPEPAELPAEAARLRLFSFLTETFGALAEDGATLLLLDDLQWADELTLRWLEYQLRTAGLRAPGTAPLLVVGTYRTEEVRATSSKPDGGLQAGEVGPGASASLLEALLEVPGPLRVKLGRLEESGVCRMVSDMLALEPPPDVFVRFLHRHSEGNPFFVAEYLRVAIAEGLLFRSEGLWQVAQERQETATESLYEALPLPRSLRETVERRLGTLSTEAQKLAEAAAVLGREMDESLLLAMFQTEVGQLEALEELRAREVLEVSATSRFRFAHDKLREVAYGRLGAKKRRALHRSAAEALEAASAAQKEKLFGELALHWEECGEPEHARPYHLAAAREARDRYAWQDAEAHYRAALRLASGPSAETLRARKELGEAVLMARGKMQQAIEELGVALGQARTLGESELEGQILRSLGDLYRLTGVADKARVSLEQALSLHRQAGTRGSEGIVLNSLAILHYEQGRLEEACSLYEQALAMHREAGNRPGEGKALNNLAIVCYDQGRLEEARSLYEQSLAIERETGNPQGEGNVLGNLAALHRDQGRLEEARSLFEQALAIYRRIGHRLGEGSILNGLGTFHQRGGRLQEACLLYEQALAILRDIGNRRFESIVLANLAALHREQDHVEEARLLQEQALAIHRELGNRQLQGRMLADMAELRVEQGNVEEAGSLFEQALDLLRQVNDPIYEARALYGLASLERRAFGELDRARRLLLEAHHRVRESRDTLCVSLCCEQGHLALAQGQSAEGCLEQAEPMAIELGVLAQSMPGSALSRLRRGQQAFEAGRPLLRGECWDDVPEALRRWLIRTGHAGEPFVRLHDTAHGQL